MVGLVLLKVIFPSSGEYVFLLINRLLPLPTSHFFSIDCCADILIFRNLAYFFFEILLL